MKKDPDLKSLHDLDEFKKIHSPAPEQDAANAAGGERVIKGVPGFGIPR